jgi:hypothetical protein
MLLLLKGTPALQALLVTTAALLQDGQERCQHERRRTQSHQGLFVLTWHGHKEEEPLDVCHDGRSLPLLYLTVLVGSAVRWLAGIKLRMDWLNV